VLLGNAEARAFASEADILAHRSHGLCPL